MKYYNIPIFVPHYGCRFDCAFCNQKHITGQKDEMTGEKVKDIIKTHLMTLPQENSCIEVAFFGGSFTGIETTKQNELLSAVEEFLEDKKVDSIRISTRPDYISHDIVKRLLSFGVKTIELGVQSMDDEVLKKSARGHTKEDVLKAVEIIKEYPIKLGLQMMTGLPGDSFEKSVATCEEIIKLKPYCVRIYPTVVLKDTKLLKMLENGEYEPETLDEAVKLSAVLIEKFKENNIKVIRIGLAASEEISFDNAVVKGPFHCAFGELAQGEMFYNKILGFPKEYNVFKINPKDISKAVGNAKKNVKRLQKAGRDIEFIQDENVALGEIIPVKG